MFDPIVASPSGKGKSPASSSATNYENSEAASRDNFIIEKHARQEEQLRQLFTLVSSLGSEIRSVVKVVRDRHRTGFYVMLFSLAFLALIILGLSWHG